MIASDHNDADARFIEALDRTRHSGTGRVHQSQEADERERLLLQPALIIINREDDSVVSKFST